MQLLLLAGTVILTVLAFLNFKNFKFFSKSRARNQKKAQDQRFRKSGEKNPESLMPGNP